MTPCGVDTNTETGLLDYEFGVVECASLWSKAGEIIEKSLSITLQYLLKMRRYFHRP